MNPKVAARQARLLRMLESKEEIRIGREQDCPLPLAQGHFYCSFCQKTCLTPNVSHCMGMQGFFEKQG